MEYIHVWGVICKVDHINVLFGVDGDLSGRLPRMDLEKTCPPAFGGLLKYTPEYESWSYYRYQVECPGLRPDTEYQLYI